MRLQASPASASGRYIPGLCTLEDAIGNAVYITGMKIDEYYPVATVVVTDVTKCKAVGIIRDIAPDGVHCAIQTTGYVQDLYTNLTPGKLVFIDNNGQLTTAVPARPTSGERALQAMGTALSSALFILEIETPIILTAL